MFSKDKEIVGSGKAIGGSAQKETSAVSGAMQISVPIVRFSLLLLQNLRRRKVGKIQHKRKVLEAEARLGNSLACHARTM